MAALTVGANRAAAPQTGGCAVPAPDHRTSRRGPVPGDRPPGQDRPVLAAAGPGRPGRRGGVVRLGRHRGKDRLRAGLPAARNLALPAPRHDHHPPDRRRGVRGLRAARLAVQRGCGQPADAPVREVVRDLLVPARNGRAGRLPPAGRRRGRTSAVGHHHLVSCLPVLVLGMGTALAHMLRADAAATDRSGTTPMRRTTGPADRPVPGPGPVRRGPGGPDQASTRTERSVTGRHRGTDAARNPRSLRTTAPEPRDARTQTARRA